MHATLLSLVILCWDMFVRCLTCLYAFYSATANLTANSLGTTSEGISPTDSSTIVPIVGSQCEREPTRPPPPPPPPGKKTTANTSWVTNPPTGYKSASETLLETTTKNHTVATAATTAPTASNPNRLEQKNHSVTTAATAAPTAPNHPNRLEQLLEEALEQSLQALSKATSNLKDLGAALEEHRSAPRLVRSCYCCIRLCTRARERGVVRLL